MSYGTLIERLEDDDVGETGEESGRRAPYCDEGDELVEERFIPRSDGVEKCSLVIYGPFLC